MERGWFKDLMPHRPAAVLITAAAFLLVFICLFLERAADDNSLFSWVWVFSQADASRVYIFLVAGLALAFFLSNFFVPDTRQAAFLFVISFAAAIPLWSEAELIVDASRYFTQAKHLERYGISFFSREWGHAIPAWTDLPLLPFLYGLIFKFFGESRLAVQIFTTGLFSSTAVLTFLIGRTLVNREAGFFAGLLLFSMPYLLTQVPLLLVDVPTMFFLALSLFTFLEAMNRGGASRSAISVAAVVCAALSKYSAWFMLSVLVVALAAQSLQRAEARDRRQVLRGISILLTAAGIVAVILFREWDVVSGQIALLRSYQRAGLGRWGESFVSTFLFQIHPFISAAAIVSLVVALRSRDRTFIIIAWLVFLALLFNVRRIRYILPLFPFLALMAAYGLKAVTFREIRSFIVYGIVASSLVITFSAYLPFARTMSVANLKQAGGYLNTLDRQSAEVIAMPSRDPVANPAVAVPLLDFFTDKPLRYLYRPQDFPSQEERERSSLRFTWEYRNPAYYTESDIPSGSTIVVVLSDADDAALPERFARRYDLIASFSASEKIFRYSLGVRVFQKKPSLFAR